MFPAPDSNSFIKRSYNVQGPGALGNVSVCVCCVYSAAVLQFLSPSGQSSAGLLSAVVCLDLGQSIN